MSGRLRFGVLAVCMWVGLAVLTGCASRNHETVTVHIFSNQPDAPALHDLMAALETVGHAHQLHYRETPGGLAVGETLLAVGEGAAAYNRALELGELVNREIGYQPAIRSRAYGNHQFTASNIGLYVHLPGETVAAAELVDRYAGTCQERAVELQLVTSDEFRLEIQRWDGDGYDLVPERTLTGTWDRNNGQHTFRSAGESWLGRSDPSSRPDQPVLVLDGPEPLADCRLMRPL